MDPEVIRDERYSHRFHAGNVGDVWKHCVLMAVVAELRRVERALCVVETHAGEGEYLLNPTGEWTEGIGKLWASPPEGPEAVTRYLEAVSPPAGAGSRRVYPGSPRLVLSLLRPQDRAVLLEIEPQAAATLRRCVHGDERAEVRVGDGLQQLEGALAACVDAEILVHIDPPWNVKQDWTTIPRALLSAWRAYPQARFMLWYPVKSYTRPNAVLKSLGESGMPGVALELITTPLELQRNRLNGSGVLLVGAPLCALVEALAAAPVLGAACATHAGRWGTRTQAWGAPLVR